VASLVVAGGAAAISWLLRPKPAAKTTPDRNELYSFALQGNQARPGQPIPEWLGRNKAFPPFAAPRYSEYHGDGMAEYGLFCLTRGRIDVEEIQVGDTPIWTKASGYNPAFEGITVQLVEPGDDVTLFPVNVETNSEVSGIELVDTAFHGSFIANTAGTLATRLLVDFIWPQGAWVRRTANDSRIYAAQTHLEIQARTVDAAGAPTGVFGTIYSQVHTLARESTIRLTVALDIAPGRYEVRARRVNIPAASPGGLAPGLTGNDAVVWTALRAHIQGPQAFQGVTVLAVKAEAGASLQGLTNGTLSVIGTRILEGWNGTTWTEAPTRSIAWAALQGFRMANLDPLDHANVANFLEHHSAWATEGWTFDYVFQAGMSLDDYLETVLRAGRAFPATVGDTIEVVREEPRGVPEMLFTDNDIQKGSLEVEYIFADESFADGMVGEYLDGTTFQLAEVPSAPEGVTLARPTRVQLQGVSNRLQAADNIRFMAAEHQYRRIPVKFNARAEGLTLRRGSLISVASEEPEEWGTTATLVGYNSATGALDFDTALPWGAATNYVELRARDGKPWGPVRVIVGANAAQAVLVAGDLAAETARQGGRTWQQAVQRADTEERPSVNFSPAQPRSLPVIVLEGNPLSDGEHIELRCVLDAPEVYSYTLTGVPPLETVQESVINDALPVLTEAPLLSFFQRRSELVARVSWQPMKGAILNEAELTHDGGTTWQRVYRDASTSFEVVSMSSEAAQARVRGIAARTQQGGPWYLSAVVVPPALALDAGQFDTVTWTIDDLEADLRARLSDDPAIEGSIGQAHADVDRALARIDDLWRGLNPSETVRRTTADPVFRSLGQSVSILSRSVLDMQTRLEDLRAGAIDAGLNWNVGGGTAYIQGIQEVAGRVNTVEVQVNANTASIALLASSAIAGDLTGILTQINTVSINLAALTATVAAKATQATVDSLGGRVTTAELRLDGIDGQLLLTASQAAVDNVAARVTTVELDLDAATGGVGITSTALRVLQGSQKMQAQTIAQLLDLVGNLQEANVQELATVTQRYSSQILANGEAIATARLELNAWTQFSVSELSRIDTVRASGDLALASSIATLGAQMNAAGTGLPATLARLVTEENVRATADAANASAIVGLSAQVNDAGTGLPATLARLVTEESTRAGADSALSTSLSGLSAQVNNATTGLPQTRAELITEEATRASADAANASSISSLSAQVNDATTGLPQTRADLTTESNARVSGDNANSNSISSLSAEVHHATQGLPATYARLVTEESTRASADSAMASNITTVTGVANEATATSRFRQVVGLSPGGVFARIAQEVSINPGGTKYFAGEYLDVYDAGGGVTAARKVFDVSSFIITNGSLNIVPFQIDGSGRTIIANLLVTESAILPGAIQERQTKGVKNNTNYDTARGSTGGALATQPWTDIPTADGSAQLQVSFSVPTANSIAAIKYNISGVLGLNTAQTTQIELAVFIDGNLYKSLGTQGGAAGAAPGAEIPFGLQNFTDVLFLEGTGTRTVKIMFRYWSNAVTYGGVSFRGSDIKVNLIKG
jgi:hypothetical protein